LPDRQGRLLFAYLTLSRQQPVSRDALVDALWGAAPPGNAAALSALISKTRSAVGAKRLRGRTLLTLALPEPARVDVEVAQRGLHEAESAVALGRWRRAWPQVLTALIVTRRSFLPEVEMPWVEAWRRRLTDVRIRALECYAECCLALGGTELPGAERASRELVGLTPFRESGHCCGCGPWPPAPTPPRP
jgi:SARP family transcriptional regulator, regulator of embCAB operon